MSFIRSPKCRSNKGKDLGSTEDVEVFPSQISEAHLIGSIGTGVIMQKNDSVLQHSRALCRVAAPSATKKHLSALLCLSPFPMLDEHTLHYVHLRNNKERIVWTCAFSLCMSHTLQMAVLIRNSIVASFCEECFFMACVRF